MPFIINRLPTAIGLMARHYLAVLSGRDFLIRRRLTMNEECAAAAVAADFGRLGKNKRWPKTNPADTQLKRFKPDDRLLAFLKSL